MDKHIPTADRPVVAAPGFVLCESGHRLPADGSEKADGLLELLEVEK